MAKKMLSKRLLDDGEFWKEIDADTKQKILDKVKKEMAKDATKRKSSTTNKRKNKSSSDTEHQPPEKRNPTKASAEVKNASLPLKKHDAPCLHKTLKHGKQRKKVDSSKTPRGIVTSYGPYKLVLIDYTPPTPDNSSLRIEGFFEHSAQSPASPLPSTSSCWEEKSKKVDPLLAIPTPQHNTKVSEGKKVEDDTQIHKPAIGIDITTSDFIMNNIGFPDQLYEQRQIPSYQTSGYSASSTTPAPHKPPISPITFTTQDTHNRWEDDLEEMLRRAKEDSIKQDRMSTLSVTTSVEAEISTNRFEYNHGHDTYSPTHSDMFTPKCNSDTAAGGYSTMQYATTYHDQHSGPYTPRSSQWQENRSTSNTNTLGHSNLHISTYAAHSKRTIFQEQSSSHPYTPIRQVTLTPDTTPKIMKTTTTTPSRICNICDRNQTNMKKHIAGSHLGGAWWGILADITCWRCCTYHNKESVGRCNGIFNQSLHSSILLQRHQDFYRFVMEDLGCDTPEELIALVRREELCNISVSNFSIEEQFFLNLIDNMSGKTSLHNRNPQNPQRLTDLTHWRTVGNIIKYASLNGTITGPAIPNPSIALIDTRADIVELYNRTWYLGNLEHHPRLQVSGRLTNFNMAITDVIDPGVMNSPLFSTMIQDPRVRITLGARPNADPNMTDTLSIHNRSYKHSPKIIAFGGVGLDITLGQNSLPNQAQTLRKYMSAAKEAKKPIRVYTAGCHAELMKELESNLPKTQHIHYLNFQGTYKEALEFLLLFPKGFIGMGRKLLKPSPDMVEITLKIDTQRMLPESNAPYHPMDFSDISTPPEVSEVISAIANIREMDRLSLCKTLRMNIHRIYKM